MAIMCSSIRKVAFVVIGLISVTLSNAKPVEDQNKDIQVLKYHNEKNADGSYDFNYKLTDGQSRMERGTIKESKDADGHDHKFLTVTGSYSFVAPSGEKFIVFYIADENGYRVQKMTSERSSELRIADDFEIQPEEDANVATTTETSEIVTETEAAS